MLTADLLAKLDELLVNREQKYGYLARQFPLYDHIQLHQNDVSKDYVAMIYTLPMKVLPSYLQMDENETLGCINGQCVGFIQDKDGNDQERVVVDPQSDYRFVAAYFDSRIPNSRMPGPVMHIGTVLHEYGHYIDGFLSDTYPSQPKSGIIDTLDFYRISYEIPEEDRQTLRNNACFKRKSDDPKDWISKYGFSASYNCPERMYSPWEEWAEAFSLYVTSGKNYREAAKQSDIVAKTYAWLKDHVFNGTEYDTDFVRDVESGCNDIPNYEQNQPGYISCSWDYVWDGELRVLNKN